MCPVIVIFAPTACGKTALSAELFGKSSLSCFKGKGAVVSADSQAVYKYMNIGTAKATPQEQQEIPHYCIDLVTPDQQFGVGDFIQYADSICFQIFQQKMIPLVVGGTGFYLRNFLMGMAPTPVSNPLLRKQITQRLKETGNQALYAELQIVDPDYAGKINVNDGYRIVRALEVFYAKGKPLSSYQPSETLRSEFSFLPIILSRPREELYDRIDQRVELMFKMGLQDEVKSLVSMGYGKDSPGMKAIGYAEFFQEFSSVDEIKAAIKNNSHHYAKKQYTYMTGIPGAVTFNPGETDKIEDCIKEFLMPFKRELQLEL